MPLWLLALWAIFSLSSLGLVPLFDLDEAIYAQTAVDMWRHHQWLIPTANGEDFFEKPPFSYYLMNLCFSLFGENSFAARLPSWLFTLFNAWILIHFAKRMGKPALGISAAIIYISMFEVGLLAHAAILDPILNPFVCLSILYGFLYLQEQNKRDIYIAAISAGIAFAIKGPIGLCLPLLILGLHSLFYRPHRAALKTLPWLICMGLFCLTALPWYVLLVYSYGWGFLHEFIWVHNIGRALHPMQGHSGAWHYYLVVFAVSSLPWFFFIPAAIKNSIQSTDKDAWHALSILAVVWIFATLILFSLVKTKLPHYISSVYPAAALLLAWFYQHKQGQRLAEKISLTLLSIVALVVASISWWSPLIHAELSHHPRVQAILSQGIHPPTGSGWAALALIAAIVYYGRQQKKNIVGLAICGIGLQVSLFLGLAPTAAKLIQGPLLDIAHIVSQSPKQQQLISFRLNMPSVSFYAQRNFQTMQDPMKLQQRIRQGHCMILMRDEAMQALPASLHQLELLYQQGGYQLRSCATP